MIYFSNPELNAMSDDRLQRIADYSDKYSPDTAAVAARILADRMDTTCRITGMPATHTYVCATGEWTFINLEECIRRGFGDPRKIEFIRRTIKEI